jgi:hypothetical protein
MVRGFALGLLLLCIVPSRAAAESAIYLGGDWGLINIPERPSATLILIPGGDGDLEVQPDGTFFRLAGNQLVRSRKHYLEQGIATLTVDKDVDVAAAVTEMRKVGSPVLVVATSRGSVRAVEALTAKPDGLVLTAAFLNEVRDAVGDPRLLPPTLIVHHRQDRCWATPPTDVLPFQEWGGKSVGVIWMEGGIDDGDPCEAHSRHGFNGLDKLVVDAVAKFALSLR